jgi:ribosomal protein L10
VATPEPSPEGAVTVPVVWVGAEDLPVHFVNQFVGVVQPNEVFLTLGTMVPPTIIGATEEERKAQVESIEFIQVKPVARIGLTPARLQELIGVLQQTLSNYERQPKV